MKRIKLSTVLGHAAFRLLPVRGQNTNENVQTPGQGLMAGESQQNSTTTIEVAQLKTRDEETIVLYLSDAGQQSTEIVLWDCASPSLKREALKSAFDPLRLLRRVNEQMKQQTQPLKAACSCCLSCA